MIYAVFFNRATGKVVRITGIQSTTEAPESDTTGVVFSASYPGLCRVNTSTRVIVPGDLDDRPLESAKRMKSEEINSRWLAANQSSFLFAGKQIECDAISRGNIDGVSSEVSLTGALPIDFPGAWKTMDNAFVPIPDVATWKSFVRAMVAQGTVNYIKAQSIKQQIAAATSLSQIDSIQW